MMFMMTLSMVFVVLFSANMLMMSNCIYSIEWYLTSISGIPLKVYLYMDNLSLMFLIAVSLITLSVLFFSISYMVNDKFYNRFHWLVMFFVISMFLLILSPNLFSILMGWDGLGVSSYLLVIYYGNSKAYNSGMITLLSNRVGDSLILISLGFLLEYGSYDMISYNYWESNLVFSLLMLAACTKSAQIPFSAWLPAAMAAPTPVSSLVHSSTLVTAGVYLMIRHEIWMNINGLSFYLVIVGLSSNLMASASALLETDLKKMVALSTLSQLGVMMVALGLGSPLLAFLHLVVHAAFKALLFVCTGVAIHASEDYQDMRIMGNLLDCLPVISSVILVCNFSLMGFPFMSSFFSKELILECIMLSNSSLLLYSLFILSMIMTASYSMRFMYMFSLRNNDYLSLRCKSSFSKYFSLSMIILLFPSVLTGYVLMDWLTEYKETPSSNMCLKLIILTLVSAGLSYPFCVKGNYFHMSYKLSSFIMTMWSLSLISTKLMIMFFMNVGNFYMKDVEKTVNNYLVSQFNQDMMVDSLSLGKSYVVYMAFSSNILIWLITLYMLN